MSIATSQMLVAMVHIVPIVALADYPNKSECVPVSIRSNISSVSFCCHKSSQSGCI